MLHCLQGAHVLTLNIHIYFATNNVFKQQSIRYRVHQIKVICICIINEMLPTTKCSVLIRFISTIVLSITEPAEWDTVRCRATKFTLATGHVFCIMMYSK